MFVTYAFGAFSILTYIRFRLFQSLAMFRHERCKPRKLRANAGQRLDPMSSAVRGREKRTGPFTDAGSRACKSFLMDSIITSLANLSGLPLVWALFMVNTLPPPPTTDQHGSAQTHFPRGKQSYTNFLSS